MINVAILGFGVVGSGTAEVLRRTNKRNHRKNEQVTLKYVLDRQDKPESPFFHLFVKDFDIILNDPDLHIVVETIGGVGAAYDMTKKSLQAGKCVVTSNKELVATHGAELLKIAQEKGGNYLFEAAVGGGIPILRPMTTCLMGNQITEVTGILNGTTNFILSKMFGKDKLSYEEALKEAQKLGYAEQDPSADVEGKDAGRKISILANIAFGGTIDPNTVPTQGITKISADDVSHAKEHNYKIKLLGRAFQKEDGQVYAYVAPHWVFDHDHFGLVNDAFNIVELKCDSLGKTHFMGQGAGDLPTASAVVGDVLDLANDLHRFRNNGWDETPTKLGDIATAKLDYSVRLTGNLFEIQERLKGLKYIINIKGGPSPVVHVVGFQNKELDNAYPADPNNPHLEDLDLESMEYYNILIYNISIQEIMERLEDENVVAIYPTYF